MLKNLLFLNLLKQDSAFTEQVNYFVDSLFLIWPILFFNFVVLSCICPEEALPGGHIHVTKWQKSNLLP